MIGCFVTLSRGNVRFVKNCSEYKAKSNALIFAATGCGFIFQLQQLLVVGFCILSNSRFEIVARCSGEACLMGLEPAILPGRWFARIADPISFD
jgi:hypothetical protein